MEEKANSFRQKVKKCKLNFSPSQGRRSERFIKPAIPLPNLGLNTSAPNVLASQNNNNTGSNVSLSSLNNSLSSTSSSSTLPSQSSGHQIAQFVQPPSPMDTESAKEQRRRQSLTNYSYSKVSCFSVFCPSSALRKNPN